MDQEKKGATFRVLGAMLPRLVGREVCVLGKVLSVAPSGQELTLKCADGIEVKCILPSPLQVSPESCVVEVQGIVTQQAGNAIRATSDLIIFSREASSMFDLEQYCYTVNLTAQFDRLYVQTMES
ncbi:hypothetical protein AAHC03_05316 [Spirometra sp. Aus1]